MKRITTNTVMIKDSEAGAFRPFPAVLGESSTLPPATNSDNGKFLSIVDGAPAWVEVTNGNEVSY